MNYAQTGFKTCFLKLSRVLAKQTFLRVLASHCHYMRSIYSMYIPSRVYIKYMCVRACVRVCVCAPDGAPAAASHRAVEELRTLNWGWK